jgi:hypothetical protein
LLVGVSHCVSPLLCVCAASPPAKVCRVIADNKNVGYHNLLEARSVLVLALAGLGIWVITGLLAVAACIRNGQSQRHAQRQEEQPTDQRRAVNF